MHCADTGSFSSWLTSTRSQSKKSSKQTSQLETLEARTMLAAANVLEGFEDTSYVSGLSLITAMEFAPDGRLFIAEKTGRVRVVDTDGTLRPEPFLTVVPDTLNENGLSGFAFDKDFETNGYVYVFYTYDAGAVVNRLSRFTVSLNDPNKADPLSETVLLDGIASNEGTHNSGAMHYGVDGMLYVALGDGLLMDRVQDLSTLAGKILRIDPSAYPNIIPADNPYVGVPGAREEIFATGFRNPFTFDIHPTDGRIYVNDVGLVSWEEVNEIVAGGNYGWPHHEGFVNDPNYNDPVYAFPHDENGAGAITGGVFYTANQFPPEYQDDYFFMNFVDGQMHRLKLGPDGQPIVTSFASGIFTGIDLDVGPDGSLYYASVFNGEVRKISYVGDANRNPVAKVTADRTWGDGPLTVNFSGAATTDPDNDELFYIWSFSDTTGYFYGMDQTHTFTQPGAHYALLTVVDGNGGYSDSKPFWVVVDDAPPQATIQLSLPNQKYHAGDLIQFSALATDEKDGVLPASAYRWTIQLHHNDIVHPGLGPVEGITSGEYRLPVRNAPAARPGEVSAVLWYRVTLTVTDSAGLEYTTYVDIQPQTANVTLATNVPGLSVELDGGSVYGGGTFNAVTGIRRTISAPVIQELNGKTYVFSGWAHGGEQTQEISSPAVDTTYTAMYREVPPQELAATYLVSALYTDLLGRSVDSQGLATWVQRLLAGDSRQTLIDALWTSTERQVNQIEEMYQRLLNRGSSENERTYWLGRFSQGSTVADLIKETVVLQSFFDLGGRGTPSTYVNTLISLFNMPRDEAHVARWIGMLSEGTPYQVVAEEMFSADEYHKRTLDLWYRQFLGRPIDDGAFASWNAAIRSGVMTLDGVGKTILGSAEYQNQQVARAVTLALYDNFLQRTPVEEELNEWTALLASGLPLETAAQIFYNSPERIGSLVTATYNSLLGRAAADEERDNWINHILGGLGQTQFMQLLVASPEYSARYASSGEFVQAVYQDLLGRPADAGGLQFWTGQLNSGMSRAALVSAVISSDEWLSSEVGRTYKLLWGRAPSAYETSAWAGYFRQVGADAGHRELSLRLAADDYYVLHGRAHVVQSQSPTGTPAGQFLTALYTDLLRRGPAQAELVAWTQAMQAGLSRSEVAGIFVNAPEYLSLLVTDVYALVLDRAPTVGEVQTGVSMLSTGMSITDVQRNLLTSAEFITKYDTTDSFLAELYQRGLGRIMDPGGAAYWSNELSSGRTRQEVVGAVLGSQEFWQHTIHGMYDRYLDRIADPMGSQYWTSQLSSNNNRLRDLAVTLLASDEYYLLNVT